MSFRTGFCNVMSFTVLCKKVILHSNMSEIASRSANKALVSVCKKTVGNSFDTYMD